MINNEERRGLGIIAVVFSVLAAGIVVAGFSYYQHYAKHFKTEVERQLTAIAELKTNELVDWRNERLGDASVLFKNPSFTSLVRRFLEKPDDADAPRELQAWLGKYTALTQYDQVRLLDAQGVTRLSVPPGRPPASAAVSQHVPEVLRTGRVTMLDFYRNDHDQRIYMAVLVPILDEPAGSKPLGVLALRIDPETCLYPFIKKWPVPSETAETLLIRRDGNDALFLNELKFKANTALNLRIPLTSHDTPAVMAALGQEGIVEGKDYRGVPVVACVRAVPGSPWFLVARMDTAEVFAHVREHLWMVVLLVAVLLLGAGAGLGFIWRRQSIRFYRGQLETTNALRESEERYRSLYYDSKDAVMIASPEKGFLAGNPETIRLFGCRDEQEFTTRTPADLSPEKQPDGVLSSVKAQEMMRLALANGSHFFEWTHRRADGAVFPATVLLSRFEKGGKQVLQATVRDITELKRAEETLRASEKRYQSVFKGTPVGILIADLGTRRFKYANPAICRLLGYTEEEFLHLGVGDIHPNESLAHVVAEFEAQAKGEKTLAPNLPCLRKDGTVIFADVSASKINIEGKECNLGFFTDTTERKRAEEAVELANRALHKGNLDLKRLNESKSELMGIVVHDLKSPLASILGTIEFISATNDDGTIRHQLAPAKLADHFQMMERSAQHMFKIIEDLMNAEMLESGRASLNLQTLDLGDLAEEAVYLNQSKAAEKKMEILLHRQPGLLAEVDMRRLLEILDNLISNAVKFSPPNTRVHISAAKPEAGKDWLQIVVRDEGPGFTVEDKTKLFGKFQKLSARPTGKESSTGLGLSIVKSLVELHHGSIRVESEAGKGAAFIIEIPQRQPA